MSADPAKVVDWRRVCILAAVILALSTRAMLLAEPGMTHVDALYLCVMTFTTIGYGDIKHPCTPLGRALTMLLSVGGIGFFGVALEHAHALRACTDGALLRLLGARGVRASALGMLLVHMAAGIALCRSLDEDTALPNGLLDGAYWAVVTCTSVGFGDHHPTTDRGKLAVCVYALLSLQATAAACDVTKDALLRLCVHSGDGDLAKNKRVDKRD